MNVDMLPYRDSRLTYIALGIFFLIVLGYAYFEARGLLFGPSITVPSETTEVYEPLLTIKGKADRISSLSMNGKTISVTEEGVFEEQYLLAIGYNRIVLDAQDKYGRARRQAIEIVYTPTSTSTKELSTTTAAPDLFILATAADIAAYPKKRTGNEVVRSRLVRVDMNVLGRHLVPTGTNVSQNGVERALQLDGVVRMELFPDVVATFHRENVELGQLGGYTWSGLGEKVFYEALLLIEDGKISGRVQLRDRLFSIDYMGENVHRITEIDPSKFPSD